MIIIITKKTSTLQKNTYLNSFACRVVVAVFFIAAKQLFGNVQYFYAQIDFHLFVFQNVILNKIHHFLDRWIISNVEDSM